MNPLWREKGEDRCVPFSSTLFRANVLSNDFVDLQTVLNPFVPNRRKRNIQG